MENTEEINIDLEDFTLEELAKSALGEDFEDATEEEITKAVQDLIIKIMEDVLKENNQFGQNVQTIEKTKNKKEEE